MKHETVTLIDSATGAEARLLPTLGFNCYSFVAPTATGLVEVLWSWPDFDEGQRRPASSGIPLLFPFAGRIHGTSFRYEGCEYKLEIGDVLGNAIHGFVLKRPWRVIEKTDKRIVGQFQASVDDPKILQSWPTDFRITVSYELAGPSLLSEIVIENPDDHPLPFGLGTHGYFRVPIGPTGAASECVVTAPVKDYWELKELLPTGRRVPIEPELTLATGMPIGQTQLDHVFSGLSFVDGRARATIFDPHNRRTLSLTFEDCFRNCVIFNPPHREAICLEPYSTAPDPFTLAAAGINPGQQLLPVGETFRTRLEIRLD